MTIDSVNHWLVGVVNAVKVRAGGVHSLGHHHFVAEDLHAVRIACFDVPEPEKQHRQHNLS